MERIMASILGKRVYVITAFNIHLDIVRSVAVCESLEVAKKMQLALYGDPNWTDGFTYFEIKEHQVQ